MSKFVLFAFLFLAIDYISVASCMPEKSRWLSKLVIDTYNERRAQQNAGFGAKLYNRFIGNVNLEVVLKELSGISDNIEIEYGFRDRRFTKRDPFKTHNVYDKMLTLDLSRASEQFLNDLISCFEDAYEDDYYQHEFLKNLPTEECFRQDTANALIYLYVIPNLLLLKKSASNANDLQIVENKLALVTQIIDWQSNHFFHMWAYYTPDFRELKLMAQSLFDDSQTTKQKIDAFKRQTLLEMTSAHFRSFWGACREHVPEAFEQIFKIQRHVPIPPSVPSTPDTIPKPVPTMPSDVPTSPDHKKRYVTRGVRVQVTGNPYLIEFK